MSKETAGHKYGNISELPRLRAAEHHTKQLEKRKTQNLFQAIEDNDVKLAKASICSSTYKYRTESATSSDLTTLAFAAHLGRDKIVQLILDKAEEYLSSKNKLHKFLDSKDSNGDTAFLVAIKIGEEKCAKKLSIFESQNKARFRSVITQRDSQGLNALQISLRTGNTEIVKALLNLQQFDINETSPSPDDIKKILGREVWQTLIADAIYFNSPEPILRTLVQRSKAPDIGIVEPLDGRNITPTIVIASQLDNVGAAAILLENSANLPRPHRLQKMSDTATKNYLANTLLVFDELFKIATDPADNDCTKLTEKLEYLQERHPLLLKSALLCQSGEKTLLQYVADESTNSKNLTLKLNTLISYGANPYNANIAIPSDCKGQSLTDYICETKGVKLQDNKFITKESAPITEKPPAEAPVVREIKGVRVSETIML